MRACATWRLQIYGMLGSDTWSGSVPRSCSSTAARGPTCSTRATSRAAGTGAARRTPVVRPSPRSPPPSAKASRHWSARTSNALRRDGSDDRDLYRAAWRRESGVERGDASPCAPSTCEERRAATCAAMVRSASCAWAEALLTDCVENPCGSGPITCECAGPACGGKCTGVEGITVTCDTCSGPGECA